MAIPKDVNFMSEQDYLVAERKAASKSEYYKGEVFAMSGASRNHNRIPGNIYALLHQKLSGKGYFPYGSDLRIHIPANTLYTYPDISVACGRNGFLTINLIPY